MAKFRFALTGVELAKKEHRVTIPDGVTYIGAYVFSNCIGLTDVYIPKSVTGISIYAFRNCVGLTKVDIPNEVTFIDNLAFEGCTNLKVVSIPNSSNTIAFDSFSNCKSLNSILYNGTKDEFELSIVPRPDVGDDPDVLGKFFSKTGSEFLIIHCTDGDIELGGV